MKKLALILAAALVMSACSLFVATAPTPTEPSTSTATLAPTTTVLAGLPVELTDCSDPPDGFDVLCDTYRLLDEHYVDPLDDDALAAGAARGLEEFESETTGTEAPTKIACAVPTAAFEDVCEVLAEVQSESPAPAVDLVEAAVRGMIRYGLEDPHTVYLSPSALAHVTEDQSGEVSGIGALVRGEDQTSQDGANCSILSATCILTIVDSLPDSPARAEGVQPGDGIVTVDGQNVDGLTVDEVVASVRGPEGTDVALGLLRNGQIIDVVITRAAVVVPVVVSEMIEPGIGFISLSQFTNNSAAQVHEALVALLADGADRLIFDLRNDPGGSLTASVRIASEFLSEGLVLRTESPLDTQDYAVEPGGAATDPDLEIVVLVNRGSASASELVSAVLQERGRATIIGEPTFGKNTVQQRFNVSNGGALSLTIARWVTPEGRDSGTVGVQPDIEPEIPEGATNDVVLDFALEYLRT